MKLIDLSQPLYHDCPNCPVHPRVVSEFIATHDSDGWLVEKLTELGVSRLQWCMSR